MKKVLVVFGTRPEAIKMAPVVKALEESKQFQPVICVTGQHRHLLDQVLRLFDLVPEYDLNLMKPNQTLFDITINCLSRMKEVLDEVKPALVLVQGDTTTAFAAGLASYYSKVPIGHIEAGLRTHDKYAPFPEEVNRHALSPMVDYHFAPTVDAVENLKKENVNEESVFCTGNTSIDALLWVSGRVNLPLTIKQAVGDRKLILMTAHRRENFGEPLLSIFRAVKKFAKARPDYHIIYPVHPNPSVKEPAEEIMAGISNITMVPPLDYEDLVAVMKESRFVLTDSGGLQEEAPTLGKPVLVLRESTERPEAVKAGSAFLVGHKEDLIYEKMLQLTVEDSLLYHSMSRKSFPFGKGDAAIQIVSFLETVMGEKLHWKGVPDFSSNLPVVFPTANLEASHYGLSTPSHS